uniref:Uncharacterized protein n=1 Tax=Oryza sativa subsp. japonica TaxID=39947 RepID=Q6ENK4_ORYSJ|nr:hypothetical protein [Oryza sativa Japonica Group]
MRRRRNRRSSPSPPPPPPPPQWWHPPARGDEARGFSGRARVDRVCRRVGDERRSRRPPAREERGRLGGGSPATAAAAAAAERIGFADLGVGVSNGREGGRPPAAGWEGEDGQEREEEEVEERGGDEEGEEVEGKGRMGRKGEEEHLAHGQEFGESFRSKSELVLPMNSLAMYGNRDALFICNSYKDNDRQCWTRDHQQCRY